MNIPLNDSIAHHRKVVELSECHETVKVTQHRLSEIREHHTVRASQIDLINLAMNECELKMKILDAKIKQGANYIEAHDRDLNGWLKH